MDKMESLNNLAKKAFIMGSDYFGEEITGIKDELHYVKFDGRWVINLNLVQDDGHPCTSGIGLYPNEVNMTLTFCSGHNVLTVPLTPEYQEELNKAKEFNAYSL